MNYSLLPTPYSLLPTPYSLLLTGAICSVLRFTDSFSLFSLWNCLGVSWFSVNRSFRRADEEGLKAAMCCWIPISLLSAQSPFDLLARRFQAPSTRWASSVCLLSFSERSRRIVRFAVLWERPVEKTMLSRGRENGVCMTTGTRS